MSHLSFMAGTGARREARLLDGDTDLDARILAAELAVMERDQRFRSNLDELMNRARRHAGLGLAGGAGTVLLLRWLLHRRQRAGASAAAASSAGSRASSLIGILQMLLPGLLGGSRRGVSGGRLMELLLSVAMPALAAWLSQRAERRRDQPVAAGPAREPAHAPLQAAEAVDLARFVGPWYEIARLPTAFQRRCASDATVSYTLVGEDRLSVLHQCRQADGRSRSWHGVARIYPGSGNAHLGVSLAPTFLRWLPSMWSDYWILMVDAGYGHVLLGTPDRTGLWLLSRTPVLPSAQYAQLIACAQAQGYDSSKLIATIHPQQ